MCKDIDEVVDDFLDDDVGTAWKAEVAKARERNAKGENVVMYGTVTEDPPETD